MIALDTTVLVRFLVEDDAPQAERAKALLQRAIDAEDPCYVSDVVLCELVWVLERTYKTYKLRRTEISQGLSRLVHARHLAFSSARASPVLWRPTGAHAVASLTTSSASMPERTAAKP